MKLNRTNRMKISELIDALENAKEIAGDVQCLVEVMSDDISHMMPVDELNFEVREGYGPSISLLA